jgi:uncharacterized protein YebE (UPF0316 family)
MKLIITFLILSIINVIFSTVRSIATIKSEKWIAAISNAGYFAYYNIVLIYAVADFNLGIKCVITFIANMVGVLLVKEIEEKTKKEKLWKFEITVKSEWFYLMRDFLKDNAISSNYIDLGKYCIFNAFCETKEQSDKIIQITKNCKGKYFVTETKM